MKRSLRLLPFTAAFVAATAVAAEAAAIIGMPLTPMSYAGVARRSVRRTAYAGAAAGAYGTVPALPAGCAVGMPCGGATYQPAYQGTNVVYVQH